MSVGPTCCDFLSSAKVSARSSLWVCDGRGHMPCPDDHAVTLTVADARRWMQRRKINSRVIRSCRRMATSQIGFPESWYSWRHQLELGTAPLFVLTASPHLLPLACHSALDRLLVRPR